MDTSSLDPSDLFGMDVLINNEDGINLEEFMKDLEKSTKKKDNFVDFQSEIEHLTNNISNRDPLSNRFPVKRPPVDFIQPEDSDNDIMSESDESIMSSIKSRRHTEDQKKTRVVSKVFEDVKPLDDFDLRKENEEDEKAFMLEEIDSLLEILKEEEVDLSRVTIPTQDSSLSDIEKVRNCLRIKNDRSRSRVFAEESFMMGVQGLEYVFDGQKSYFGRYPDLTGWSDTVQIKLRRMRYDTSTFVNNIMRQYNFGPGTRIMLELIPSAFIYSRMKKKHHGDDIYTKSEMNAAIDQIRNIHEGVNEDPPKR